jgi:glyoxylase-like metal-dependent hydrolase (beta-lactamase superfamily II)
MEAMFQIDLNNAPNGRNSWPRQDQSIRKSRMAQTSPFYRVGDATITKILEIPLIGQDPNTLYPGQPDIAAFTLSRASAYGPNSIDSQTGLLHQSIHTWLVRTPTQVILVDTGTGNDKERPHAPIFHHLREPFLDRLAAEGVRPEDVDIVLLTHLHADHVGWNTRLVDGRWRPTFPNARHIFSGRERAYSAALARKDGSDAAVRSEAGVGSMTHPPMAGVYEDSMLPIIEAGLAQEIMVNGADVLEGFSFLPSPGHSIDHACISFTSRGERALFWGDVMHHPLQVERPDLNSCYCEFPEAAVRSRHWAITHAAETSALIFSTHFADSSAGRIARDGDRFTWHFV